MDTYLICGVFPINIDTIESILSNESNAVFGKVSSRFRTFRQFGKGVTQTPPANGGKHVRSLGMSPIDQPFGSLVSQTIAFAIGRGTVTMDVGAEVYVLVSDIVVFRSSGIVESVVVGELRGVSCTGDDVDHPIVGSE